MLSNQAAAESALSTANYAANAAAQAQSSAKQAQVSAEHAEHDAEAAGALGIVDTAALGVVNQRISDLDPYRNQLELVVFFPESSILLNEATKQQSATLAELAKSIHDHMIEISGNTIRTTSSWKRIRSVANNVPLWSLTTLLKYRTSR